MTPEPFCRADGPGAFVPTRQARGPWDPSSLHARVAAGLFAFECEERHLPPGFRCARLTIDLFRLPPLAPCEITTNVIRDGNRIKVVEGEYRSGGTAYARATAVFLRASANPAGAIWRPPGRPLPDPSELEQQNWEVSDDPPWEVRQQPGDRMEAERKVSWLRETRPLVEGHDLTPFVRAALAADWTSPFANWGTAGLEYINADITLYLHRLPVGEWIGFEVLAHQQADGIAVGDCTISDLDGPIGQTLVCAVANSRRIT